MARAVGSYERFRRRMAGAEFVRAEPSPYERLLTGHAVAALEQRAGELAGFKVSICNDEDPLYPPWLLWSLPDFALGVIRLCRSHLALQEILNALPAAEERAAEVESESP